MNNIIYFIMIPIIIALSISSIIWVISSGIECNGSNCWFDSPLLNNDYYIFHANILDDCTKLQSKLDLYHPNGTHPAKLGIINKMNQLNCDSRGI